MSYSNHQASNGQSKKKTFSAATKTPVTAIMVNKMISQKIKKIGDQDIAEIILVGKLERVDVINNKIMIQLNDCTSKCRITMLYDKQNSECEDLIQGRYAKLIANMMFNAGQLTLYCQHYKMIQDFNEVSDHIAQVIYRFLERTVGSLPS